MEHSHLIKCLRVNIQNIRAYGKHNKKFLYKDRKNYEGISYYPRNGDVDEPKLEPSKLLRVQRIKPFKGNPFWEKRILKDLGLDNKQTDFSVIKNIPENNARLWKIKHLIKVTPITFPYGEPKMQDINHTVLKENGKCIVTKNIGSTQESLQARNEFDVDCKRLDTNLLKTDARLKWLNPW